MLKRALATFLASAVFAPCVFGTIEQGPDQSTLSYLQAGSIFSAAVPYTCPTAGANNPAVYFRNPTGSGKVAMFISVIVNVSVTNVLLHYHVFSTPTASANGSTVNAYQRNIGLSTSPVSLVTTAPTITSVGNLLIDITDGQNSGPVELLHDFSLGLQPNSAVLFACDPSSNNREVTFTLVWAEVPI